MVWVHSDRIGCYETLSGAAYLASARRRMAPSIRVRITHHPRWQRRQRDPGEEIVVLGAPPASSRLQRPRSPMVSADLSGRLMCPAQPDLPRVLSALTGLHVGVDRGRILVSTDETAWQEVSDVQAVLVHPSAPATCRCPMKAAVQLSRCGLLPERWRSFPPFDWAAPDGQIHRLPRRTLDVAFATATDGAVGLAIEALHDFAARLARWGIGGRARRIVCVASPLDLKARERGLRAPTRRGVEVLGTLLALARGALALRPEISWAAERVASQFDATPALRDLVLGSLLWRFATMASLCVPADLEDEDVRGDRHAWSVREGLYATARGQSFGDLPDPFRPLLEVYGTGLVPLATDQGMVVGVPAVVDAGLPRPSKPLRS